jgi:filamentous hemagglutinin
VKPELTKPLEGFPTNQPVDGVTNVFQSRDTNEASDSNKEDGTAKRIYSPTQKHEAGGWGTVMDLNPGTAQKVLNEGITGPNGKQIYGYENGKIYVFQPDNVGGFHGYPEQGNRIPHEVLKEFRDSGKITKSEYKRLIKGQE